MPEKPLAVVTGANQGIGLQRAKDLRVALLGPEGPTGKFTRRENQAIP